MRTEQDVLNDFEKLGWKILINNKEEITLRYGWVGKLFISRCFKYYQFECSINIQEHKLLNELFIIWGWI